MQDKPAQSITVMISIQPLRIRTTSDLSMLPLQLLRFGGQRSLTNSAAAIRRCNRLPAGTGAAAWNRNTMRIAVPPKALLVTQIQSQLGNKPFSNSAAWLDSNQPEAQPAIRTYDFETIKKLSENPSPDKIIIDVREPHELQKSGQIPTAINIPLRTQPDALFLSEEEFHERLGIEKPEADKEVVFYCKSGVRSKAAAQIATAAGYTSVSEYPGSWNEWADKTGSTKY